ncbi:DC1 - like 10 [Theobroma cacao]|nr:DC1 - like 10 [Theobroma cacao]
MKLDQGSTSSLLDSEASMSKVQIEHFDHQHPLSYNETIEQNESLLCNACRQEIFYQHYACEDCKYYLHETCTTLPYEVSHPLHCQHLLKLFTDIVEFTCHGCREHSGGFAYMCLLCDFQLDVKCATTPIPPQNERQKLKEMEKVSKLCPFNQNHKLDFFNRRLNFKDLVLECDACKLPILGPEDVSEEYYCDICEEERKPKHSVYCCKKCKFIAHIECALNKVQIEHFDHLHLLSYNEAIEQNENLLCNACRQEIFDQHYACEDCKYYLHEMCTTLSYEVSHPLHRQHPLKLFTDIVEFTCHGCRDHSGGFAYMCLPCDFQLDVKCATSPILPKNERQKLKEMEKVSKVCPFNQNHKLDFFNHRPDLKDLALACDACKLPILGPGYTCRDCFNVKIHESCLALMREMQLTFHPLHPLYPQIGDWENCSACRFKIIERIGYSCRQCDFHLHLHCANSLKLALKIKSHMHNLYYFGPDYEKSYHLCNKCKSYIDSNVATLDCVPVSKAVIGTRVPNPYM